MNVPQSISSITTDTSPDPFASVVKLPDLPLDEIIAAFKRSLTAKELEDFQTGLAYFKKDISSEKAILKNIFNLVCEMLIKAINNSDLDVDLKPTLAVQIKMSIESLCNNFDAFYTTLIILNKNKNLLDVKGLILIIIGYAISLLKKTNNG